MHHSNPWEELYKNWPARNDREAHALRLLSEAKSDKIMEETGMSREELRDFMEWAREYETSHLCIEGGSRNAGK